MIFVNFPFSIFPMSLKFDNFSDNGAVIFFRLTSILLSIFDNKFKFVFCLKNDGKLVASNFSPCILIIFPKEIEKSLFSILFLKVLTFIFF